MSRLNVNIDHVATLRQARGGVEPDPITAATICELAGAEGIVCHLREDRRHASDRDVRLLKQIVQTKLDLEMAANEEIIQIALEVVPHLVTIVPEHRLLNHQKSKSMQFCQQKAIWLKFILEIMLIYIRQIIISMN